MKRLKLFICVYLIILCVNVVNAVYEEPMGEECVEEISDTQQTETIKKVSEVLGDRWTLAEAIVIGCTNHAKDINLCIEHVFWVANAESSLFKNVSSSNNAFWWMYNWKLKRFSSIEEWIIQWIRLYEKNWWSIRDSGQKWLDWHYCTSSCSYRISNYNVGIAKIRANLY